MKIRALSRSADDFAPRTKSSQTPAPRSLNPALHPHERAREYVRAVNAVKLDRLFAKPFLGSLGDGHVDGVYSLCKDPRRTGVLASSSGDGIVKLWNLVTRKETFSAKRHSGMVTGVVFNNRRQILSCGSDKHISMMDEDGMETRRFTGANGFTGITHHRSEPVFATSSTVVELWHSDRDVPTSSLTFGTDSHQAVAFNQTEVSTLASLGSDRSLTLYDIRTSSALARLTMALRGNDLCWNPQEAFNLAVANEDHNVYIYDMRNLKRAINVLKDHVSAVMSVSFSPTGQEIVTGAYDRTVRLWDARQGRSRDVYHTKRMQRVFSTCFSADSAYVISGSDDGGIRLWRSKANSRSGVQSARQRERREYEEALVQRYEHLPEIKRIKRQRLVPKNIRKAAEIKRTEEASIARKDTNRRRHEIVDKRKDERSKNIVNVSQ
ncbi:Protein sof1 [Savitreella phatthalungensis]